MASYRWATTFNDGRIPGPKIRPDRVGVPSFHYLLHSAGTLPGGQDLAIRPFQCQLIGPTTFEALEFAGAPEVVPLATVLVRFSNRPINVAVLVDAVIVDVDSGVQVEAPLSLCVSAAEIPAPANRPMAITT